MAGLSSFLDLGRPWYTSGVKIVACDPGESFGYCTGTDNVLESAGTVDMWEFVHALGETILPQIENSAATDLELLDRLDGVEQVVIEDWQLYPKEMKAGALDWDKCRTARAIGAIEFICRAGGVPYVLQPAKIKETAQAAGVENLYDRPLHENRHQNDAMQHFVYFNLKRGNPPVRWAEEGVPA